MLKRHSEVEEGRRSDSVPIEASSIWHIFMTIFHVAWRDGLVQLALYASTQAMSILSSLFLGLSETGTYSVLLQLANAVYNFASTYPKSFYPAMQSAFAEGNLRRQRRFVSMGIVGYWALFVFGMVGVCAVILPMLPLFKPGVVVDYGLFLAMCLYMGLLQQHHQHERDSVHVGLHSGGGARRRIRMPALRLLQYGGLGNLAGAGPVSGSI